MGEKYDGDVLACLGAGVGGALQPVHVPSTPAPASRASLSMCLWAHSLANLDSRFAALDTLSWATALDSTGVSTGPVSSSTP